GGRVARVPRARSQVGPIGVAPIHPSRHAPRRIYRLTGMGEHRALPEPVDRRALARPPAPGTARLVGCSRDRKRPHADDVQRGRDRDLGVEAMTPEGERPAFYALPSGGWRDYVTLLHPPYTVWHLSYVVIGACTVADVNLGYLPWSVLAFFGAVGLGAHALDELNGRPLGTAIPSPVLIAIAFVGLGGAVVLGIYGVVLVSSWMLAFIVVGAFIALAYNLEWFHGAFHSDLWFALGWGAFPALTAAFAQTGNVSVGAVAAAAGCAALSAAQRVLSTPVRQLRRHAVSVEGRVTFDDGVDRPLDNAWLRSTPERALRLLSLAVPLLAAAMVAAAVARRWKRRNRQWPR